MVQLAKLVLFGTLWPATMRERHLMLLAWMSHPPSLAPWQAKACTPKHQGRPPQGTNTWIHFGEQHGLALLTWQAHALPKPYMTGHLRKQHLMA
ncbi:hypothetical protein TIFTF001_046535 [Ficus carica]|uniref:Uncharacterized protein n=1 Tax=Ficus carica TaxID=3494 RepID=A0AA87ZCW3_FICCA|nr:hypothetical protein TIFTF001_046535 [Ficus carica]